MIKLRDKAESNSVDLLLFVDDRTRYRIVAIAKRQPNDAIRSGK